MPVEEQSVARENKLAAKLEHFVRRTDAETAKQVAIRLANSPVEKDSEDLFVAVRKANYANRKRMIFKMGVSIVGLGATVAGIATPMVAPGCILYAIGAVMWMVNDGPGLYALTKRMAEKKECRPMNRSNPDFCYTPVDGLF